MHRFGEWTQVGDQVQSQSQSLMLTMGQDEAHEVTITKVHSQGKTKAPLNT